MSNESDIRYIYSNKNNILGKPHKFMHSPSRAVDAYLNLAKAVILTIALLARPQTDVH
jgi:tryptophan 2,3-dioxygenase